MAIITVTSTADSGAGSLRAALAAAQDGDVILFDDDVFPDGQTTSILLSSWLAISKSVTINGDGRVALDAQNAGQCAHTTADGATVSGVVFRNANYNGNGGAVYSENASVTTYYGCTFEDCTATNGGAIFLTGSAQNVVNNCVFEDCVATSNGGAIYSANTSQNTLNDCTISGCTATSNGAGVYAAATSQNTLNDCTITNCVATGNGGGTWTGATAQLTLNDCTISNCAANYGGGVYGKTTLNNCTFEDCAATNNGAGAFFNNVGNVLNNCSFDAASSFYTTNASTFTIEGITTLATATLNSATFNFSDGAALTLTGTATINAATFAADGRAYLALAAGINTSAATFTNVVACAYGANITSFTINDAGAVWTADDLTTTVLLETRDDGGDWDTLAQAAGGSYVATFGIGTIARAFDGLRFWVAEISAYWQVASFVVANNGGGGAGDSAACWVVENKTITPNISGV